MDSMRATAKCPKCGEILTTDCKGCIIGESAWHKCPDEEEADVIDVEWKVGE